MTRNRVIAGDVFGDLVIISRVNDTSKGTKYVCKCVCGMVKEYFLSNMRKGKSTSCGCTRGAKVSSKLKTHSKKPRKLYEAWTNMKTRCSNHNTDSFQYYGAKGIKVCDEWVNDFAAFRDWSLVNGFDSGLSIDRVDVSKGYKPGNCRWASDTTQARNKNNSWRIEIDGVNKHAKKWCELNGINYSTACTRKTRGWSDFDAVSTPTNSAMHHRNQKTEATE